MFTAGIFTVGEKVLAFMAGVQAEGLMVDRSLILSYTLVPATDFSKYYTNVRFTPFLGICVCQKQIKGS